MQQPDMNNLGCCARRRRGAAAAGARACAIPPSFRPSIQFGLVVLSWLAVAPPLPAQPAAPPPDAPPAIEETLVRVIKEVAPAFVFIGGGSGVCISEDGWIVTNWHVVAPPMGGEAAPAPWRVVFAGGRRCMAELTGFSLRGDLALLKVRDGKGLPFAELGDSDALDVGQHVFAVGNPFMLGSRVWEPSVEFGIVSALHRFQEGYSDAIQTDAQVNPGNSGGPLFTLAGKIVGINGRIALKYGNRVNTGIGYAIPSNQIKRFLPVLKKGGRVYHGFVDGLQISDPDAVGREYGTGVLVAGVYDGSPAAKAGFQPGDLVVRIEGFRTFNTKRFHGVVGTYPAGVTVTMTVRRGEEEKDLLVYLGENREDRTAARGGDRPKPAARAEAWLGLTGFRAAGGAGLEVDEVEPDSPAERAGLRVGDLLLEADGKPVNDFRTLRAVLKEKAPGDMMTLKVKRNGETSERKVKLERAPDEGGKPGE